MIINTYVKSSKDDEIAKSITCYEHSNKLKGEDTKPRMITINKLKKLKWQKKLMNHIDHKPHIPTKISKMIDKLYELFIDKIKNCFPNKCKSCIKRYNVNRNTVPEMHCTGYGLRMHDYRELKCMVKIVGIHGPVICAARKQQQADYIRKKTMRKQRKYKRVKVIRKLWQLETDKKKIKKIVRRAEQKKLEEEKAKNKEIKINEKKKREVEESDEAYEVYESLTRKILYLDTLPDEIRNPSGKSIETFKRKLYLWLKEVLDQPRTDTD